jgi:hypothetical protein
VATQLNPDSVAHPGSAFASTGGVRLATAWIISRPADLAWLIGGALAGYAAFFLHAGLQWDMVLVWFLWTITLDSPHFFGTYARTYFDREEWRQRRGLLLGSLGVLLVGPLVLLLCYGLLQSGSMYYRLPFFALIAMVQIWAYWHVVRQHYGILALYRRKNGDSAALDRHIDNAFLYVSLWAAFLIFVIRHPESRQALGMAQELGVWETPLILGALAGVGVVFLLFFWRQLQTWQRRKPLNVPKILFLAAVVPLHLVICCSEAVLAAPLLAFALFVTIFHDIQYHALVWFYQKNRYRGNDASQYGAAAWLGKRFVNYALAAIAMGTLLGFLGCSLEIFPGCAPVLSSSSITLFGEITVRDILFTVFLAFLMHHYLLDQFIWRPSKDSRLQRDLNI